MIEWRLDFAPDHPVGAGHFPGMPIVPGALLLECVLAGLALRIGQAQQGTPDGAAALGWQVRSAKFPSPAVPGQTVEIAAAAGPNGLWRVTASVASRRVLIAEVRSAEVRPTHAEAS